MTRVNIGVSNTIYPGLPFIHLPSVISNSCHFELFFDSPESSQSLVSTAFPGTTTIIYLVAKTVSKLFNFIEWIPLQFFKAETNKQEKTMIDSYIIGLTLFVSALQKIPLHNCTLYDFKTFFETIITKIENHLDCSEKFFPDIQEISSIWKNKKQ